MFRVTMLPAGHGDCLWIEYGPTAAPHHVLIDAGTTGTYPRLKKAIKARFGNEPAHFELFVITHIDADHIGGAVKLLADPAVTYGDIWFNGWDHLHGRNPLLTLGAKQAEAVSQTIADRGLPWNKAFRGWAAVIKRWPVRKKLPGGLVLTLLSPYPAQFPPLIDDWEDALRAAGLSKKAKPARASSTADSLALGDDETLDVDALAAEEFESDGAAANGSSIAFLAEYEGKRALFTGDAHAPVLLASLQKLQPKSRIKLDLVKLAHHGSAANTSNELLDRLTCARYFISSNGAYFQHPERRAIARLITRRGRKKLFFNYRSAFNSIWGDAGLQSKYGYEASYPIDETTNGVTLDL